MRKIIIITFILSGFQTYSQNYPYAESEKNPYGLPNPNAPKEITDYKEMIGKCYCKSVTRIDQNTWADTVLMTWEFKYIMNGYAVQDITYKEDGAHSGSIRQYNADSSRWYVHYYSSKAAPATLPAWGGTRVGNRIVLYRKQPAPNKTPGYYRLTFYDLSDKGFNWLGEWVDISETFSYPTWKIFCRRKME